MAVSNQNHKYSFFPLDTDEIVTAYLEMLQCSYFTFLNFYPKDFKISQKHHRDFTFGRVSWQEDVDALERISHLF